MSNKKGSKAEATNSNPENIQLYSFDELLDLYKKQTSNCKSNIIDVSKFIITIIVWFVIYITICVGFSIYPFVKDQRFGIVVFILMAVIFIAALKLGGYIINLIDGKLAKKLEIEKGNNVETLKGIINKSNINLTKEFINYLLNQLEERKKSNLFGNTIITAIVSTSLTYILSTRLNGVTDFASVDFFVELAYFLLVFLSVLVLFIYIYNSFGYKKHLNSMEDSLKKLDWEIQFIKENSK